MYVNQAVSPEVVVLRPQPPLMPYRRRITIGRQSGGGPLHLPRSCRRAPGPDQAPAASLFGQQHRWHDHLLRRSSARAWRAGPSQLWRRVSLAGSDRESPRFTARSGTQRARAYFGEHLIRRSGQVVQDRPPPVMRWADVPYLSAPVSRCPVAWQQRQGYGVGRCKARAYASSKALHDASSTAGTLAALVLITTCGPSPTHRAWFVLLRPPPPNPTAADPGDGRVLSRPSSRVHEPCTSTEVVALR